MNIRAKFYVSTCFSLAVIDSKGGVWRRVYTRRADATRCVFVYYLWLQSHVLLLLAGLVSGDCFLVYMCWTQSSTPFTSAYYIKMIYICIILFYILRVAYVNGSRNYKSLLAGKVCSSENHKNATRWNWPCSILHALAGTRNGIYIHLNHIKNMINVYFCLMLLYK